MRIGIDGRYAEGNLVGIGKYIKHLTTGLSERGVEVVLFYSRKPKTKIRGKNITLVVLPYVNRYLLEQVALSKAFKKEKIDLYHAAGNIGVPWFSPVPSVLTVHDIIPLTTPGFFNFSSWPPLSRASFSLRTITSCWKARKIMTDTNFVKQQLITKLKIKERKIRVVNLGVEVVRGRKRLPEKVEEGKYILNHGGIGQRKNLERLIKAFSKINKQFPELKLVITGDDPFLKPKLEQLAKELNLRRFVIFTGYVDEETLWSLIRCTACVCFPSLLEGFGMPVIEGFAAGVPVVSSNTTSIPELADEAAVLVNPEDEGEIAAGIRKVLSDQNFAQELVKKGLARVQNYTWKKMIDETLKVYKQVLCGLTSK